MRTNIVFYLFLIAALLLVAPLLAVAQEAKTFQVTGDKLTAEKSISLDKTTWKYRSGDNAAWAAPDFDDGEWDSIEGAMIDPSAPPPSGWNGRAWFRLRLQADEAAASRTLALVAWQMGASEIYLNGRLIVRFGTIRETDEFEYNPARLPVPIKFDRAGEQVLAIRYSLSTMRDQTSGTGRWLARGTIRPGFSIGVAAADDVRTMIQNYANTASMRIGFLLVGVLSALALLHFLLFVFYRAERANLFYSLYAGANAITIVCGNFLYHGHQGILPTVALGLLASLLNGFSFVSLMAFLHVAFRRRFGIVFWTITGIWAVTVVCIVIFINLPNLLKTAPMLAITLFFTYSIFLLINALRERQPGAWILLGGVQVFSLGMLVILLSQFRVLNLPSDFSFLAEIALTLGVPVAVSIYLARNFARTNRDLQTQLVQVKELSEQKIEQERQSVILRAENERRAKELEEARQLQLSLLPKKLPVVPNLEIAAYMKPATEVGGDYYDFHISPEGTLTIAVGDATGHGLKAGTMVTATKSLFNNLAAEPALPEILCDASAALKKMNLRGMFMALTMARIGGDRLQICQAGMPPALLFRQATGAVEEFASKALPLGAPLPSAANGYVQQETVLAAGDCLLIMSDGFPEMFNPAGEMLGFESAAEILRETVRQTAAEIVRHFVSAGEKWAGTRPADDDVTFVVVKITEKSN